jgi:hypothetical protein
MGADKMGQDKMAKDAPMTMMVTGCVAESGGKYMLNNAMKSDSSMSGGAPMAGGGGMAGGGTATGGGAPMAGGTATGGSAPMGGGGQMGSGGQMAGGSGMAMSYMLSGGTLKPHVGHKVEVTGMMKPMSKDMDKGAMGKDMPKDSATSGSMAKDGKSMGTIDVKSVKMLAPTCS